MPISKTKGAIWALLGVSSCAVLFRGDSGSYDVALPEQKVGVRRGKRTTRASDPSWAPGHRSECVFLLFCRLMSSAQVTKGFHPCTT